MSSNLDTPSPPPAPTFSNRGEIDLTKNSKKGGGGGGGGGGGVGGGKVAEEWGDPKKVGFCKQQRGGVLLVWVFFLA